MPKVLQKYKSMIYSEDRHGQVSFVYWVLQKEQPMKSLLSANLSLLQLVGSTVGWSVFSRSCWFFFRLFWMKLHYFNMYELTALFLWKFYFCTYLAKNSPKIGNSVLFFWFFVVENFIIWFSWKQSERRNIVMFDLPLQCPCRTKF